MRERHQIIFGLVLALVALIGGQILFATPVFGVTNASISITIPSSVNLNLKPEAFDSVSQSISVTTNNYTGFTASLNNPNNSTSLVNTSDNTKTIPTITLPQGSNSITYNQFTVGYGFSTDGTNYVPAPTSSSSISLGNRNTAGTSSYSLYFGGLVDASTIPGTYTKSFVITAVVNNPQYSLTYNANAGADTVTNMPSNISVTPSSTGTITLSNNVPTRSGYSFLGWDTDNTATTPTYATGNTNTIALEPTQANAITLYAIWEETQGGGSGTEGDPYIVADNTYDASEVQPGYNSFPNVPGAPSVVAVDDGSGNTVITSFEYTDASAQNPVTITSGNSVETGIIALDGGAFAIHIKFKADLAETVNGVQINKNKFLVTAFECNNGVYNGFALNIMNTGYLRIATYKDRTRSAQTGLLTASTYSSVPSSALSAGVHEFDVTLTYDPTGYQSQYGQLKMETKIDGTSQSNKFIRNTSSTTNVPTSLNSAIITLGGNGVDNSDDIGNIDVLEFSVTKQ